MSLNFPTAFWKDSNPSDSNDGVDIDWNLYLYYSTNGNIGASQVTSSSAPSFSAIADDAHPYTVEGFKYYADGGKKLYSESTRADQDDAFFGWYLDGYAQNDLAGFHRANPWILGNNGKELNLFFEADYQTFWDLQWDVSYTDRGYSDGIGYTYYNHFIQSGYAVGSFNLSQSRTINILASGLGERFAYQEGNEGYEFDTFQLYINDELICSGQAPKDQADFSNVESWDMNHCKFFNHEGTQNPPNYLLYERKDEGTSIQKYNPFDETTTEISNVVEQTTRRNYVKEPSRFTGTTGLDAGDHEIKIFYNTNDALYNSGAFYGATFNFS